MNLEKQVAAKTPDPIRSPWRGFYRPLQRKCACGGSDGSPGECEECMRNTISLRRRASHGGAPRSVPPIVHETLRSPGKPLDPASRAFMEPRFGHDFSKVRVHTDERAAESARAVNALAYTVGDDLVFGRGQYEPRAFSFRRLLAHELTHVVQQRASAAASGSDAGNEFGLAVSEAHDALEVEAELAASRVISPGRVHVTARPASPAIVRRATTLDPFRVQLTAEDVQKLDEPDLLSLVNSVREGLRLAAEDSPEHQGLQENLATIENEVFRRNAVPPRERAGQSPEKKEAAGPEKIPVGLSYQVVGVVGEPAPQILSSDLAGLSTALSATVGSTAIPTDKDIGQSDPSTGYLPGALSATGTPIPRFLDPIPGTGAPNAPNVYTRFIGPESPSGFLEPGRLDVGGELAPKLFQSARGSAAETARLDAFQVFERQGIKFGDLSRLSRALRSKGVAGLSSEELALFERVVKVHAEVGGTPASPLLSLTELSPEQALQKLPAVATRRAYVVRVRVDPKDVARVNEVLKRTGQSGEGLAGELEVVVAQDLRGQGAKILSVTRNLKPGAPLAGVGASALQWVGRGLVFVGAALTVKEIVTAQGPHRRETEGRAFGSFAGGTMLGAFGAGLCIGLGVATAGAGLLLCGLAFGAVGAIGGGAVGGALGRQFD